MHKRSKMVKNKLKLTFCLQDVWKPVLYILQKQCICSLRDWCQNCNLHVHFYFLSWTYQGSWGVGTLCEWQFIHFKRCHSVWLLFQCLKFRCLCSFDFFYSIRLWALFPVTSESLIRGLTLWLFYRWVSVLQSCALAHVWFLDLIFDSSFISSALPSLILSCLSAFLFWHLHI